MADQYLTVKEFSALFKVADKTIYRKTLSGEIPSLKIFGRIRIPFEYALSLDPKLLIRNHVQITQSDLDNPKRNLGY